MSSDYRTLNHSKFLLIDHLIFVVKYRKKLLKKYGDEMKQFVFESEKNLILNFRKGKLIRITFI
jgi:REP element-mobilizing transposase RayT